MTAVKDKSNLFVLVVQFHQHVLHLKSKGHKISEREKHFYSQCFSFKSVILIQTGCQHIADDFKISLDCPHINSNSSVMFP